MKIDSVNKEIIKALQENSRRSFLSISKRLGIAETTVRYRVRRLIEKGVIVRFATLVNPRKLGYEVAAFILFKVEPWASNEITESLEKFRQLHHVFKCTGEYDIAVIAHTQDLPQLDHLVNEVKSINGVREASLYVITEIVKMDTRYL